MAAMTTTLTEFSDSADSRTYTLSGHTVGEPRLVIQKRKVPTSVAGVSESDIKVVYGTTDSNGDILSSKISFEAKVRMPVSGDSTDVTAALAVFRDIIAGDEFGNTVTTQEYLI